MNLNQVTVPCLDIKESIAFYKKLGLELIVHTHNGYARFLCPEGNSTFSLHRVDTKHQSQQIVVYFEVADLDKKIKELISCGLAIEEMPNLKPWLWNESRLKDPFGNQIIIYYAGENRINPPWKIKSADKY